MSQKTETEDSQTRIRSRKYVHSCCRTSQTIGALQPWSSSSLAPSRGRSLVNVPDFRSRIWRRPTRCIPRGTWPACVYYSYYASSSSFDYSYLSARSSAAPPR
eukprot:7599760-Heterocapsa_arctica.AAC.1